MRSLKAGKAIDLDQPIDRALAAPGGDGRAGRILVHAGNLATANNLPLVVLNQIKPMDVFFSLPQAELESRLGLPLLPVGTVMPRGAAPLLAYDGDSLLPLPDLSFDHFGSS